MKTPREEGWSVGYLGTEAKCPYEVGLPGQRPAELQAAADEWHAGVIEGREQAREDLWEKRVEAGR